MADPLLFPDNQAAKIRQLEDRIRILESSNRLSSSAIKDGTLTVYDGTGVRQIAVGLQDDGHYGLLVGASLPIPAVDVDSVDGMSYPQIPVVWGLYASYVITGGALAEYAYTTIPVVSHKGILIRVRCNTSVGTTGEVRIVRLGAGSTSSNTVTVPSDSFLLDIDFWWLHGGTIGQLYKFSLQTRRASGAGTFNISDPLFSYMVGPEHCSTAGTYVP